MSRLRQVHFELRSRFPSLRHQGVAVEYFPAYRKARRESRLSHDILYGSLLLGGTVTHWIDDEAVTEEAGTLAIVGYDRDHIIVTGAQAVEVFNLYLDPARHPLPVPGGDLGRRLGDLLPLHPGLIHHRNRLSRLRLPDPRRTAGWMHALAHEQEHPGAGTTEAITHLASLILLDLARACADQGVDSPLAVADPGMETIRQLIDAECCEDWPIGRYARRAGLSDEHFSRRFARHAGQPPVTYRRHRRLQEALRLLRESDRPVTQVALDSGFSDLAHFNRSFRQLTGTTPRAYRRGLAGG